MTASSSGKQFIADEFRWLDQVVSDLELSPNAAGIAVKLIRYFNRTTREAWPAQETLAATLGLSERRVRSNLAAMVARGHLQLVRQGKRGRGHSNHYRMALKPLANKEEIMKGGRYCPPLAPEAEESPENRTLPSIKPDASVQKGGRYCPPNLSKNLIRTLDAQTETAGSLASGPDDSPLTRPPLTDTEASKQADDREAALNEVAAAAIANRVVRKHEEPPYQDNKPTIRKPPEGGGLMGALARLGASVRGEPVDDAVPAPAQRRVA